MINRKDNRKFLRIDCLFNVKVIDIKQAKTVDALGRRISAGGVCILTDKPLPDETGLLLKFHFPDRRQSYNVEGRTVWSKPAKDMHAGKFENGIEFYEVNRELNHTIKDNTVCLHLQVDGTY